MEYIELNWLRKHVKNIKTAKFYFNKFLHSIEVDDPNINVLRIFRLSLKSSWFLLPKNEVFH